LPAKQAPKDQNEISQNPCLIAPPVITGCRFRT
jgi:hypothetical protein